MFRWLKLSSEQKDVIAIRGLETELYNKILAKAKETGKNVSDLMNDAMRSYLNQVQGTSTVFGENMDNITVTKKDLSELGKVAFKEVTNLKFTKDIDKETFTNNVLSIEDCDNVQVPEPLYLDAMKKAKGCHNVLRYSIEEQTQAQDQNFIARLFLNKQAQDQNIIRIGGIDNLEISKSDLESIGQKVIFENIDELKLSPDVDANTINQYIEAIRNVDELSVPKNVFLLILTKTRDCDEVNKY
jgi:hypothetical protein